MNDLVFEQVRNVLLSKQKELKKKGKGNKPNASVALTSGELSTFYEKDLLGTRNPEVPVLNTLLLNINNTMHLDLEAAHSKEICAGVM